MRLRQAAPVLFLVLLQAAGGLAAQEDRSEAQSGPSDAGHSFEASSGPEPSSFETPPEPPAVAPSAPSSEGSSDTSTSMSGRYAVPVTELPEPHRQRPTRPPVEPPPSGGDVDEPYDTPEPSGEPYTAYEDVEGRFESHPSGGAPGRSFLGALDLDLSPGRTQVYLDGQYMGIVDQYDGWPSFLVLPEGEYELVFYLDGFKTLVRRVRIDPGTVIKMNDRLERGPSIRPEDLVSGQMFEGSTSGGR